MKHQMKKFASVFLSVQLLFMQAAGAVGNNAGKPTGPEGRSFHIPPIVLPPGAKPDLVSVPGPIGIDVQASPAPLDPAWTAAGAPVAVPTSHPTASTAKKGLRGFLGRVFKRSVSASELDELYAGITQQSLVIVGLDLPFIEKEAKDFRRGYLVASGQDILDGNAAGAIRTDPRSVVAAAKKVGLAPGAQVLFFPYPTKTYSEGFGGKLFSDMAPEDREVSRKLAKHYPGRVRVAKVPLSESSYFTSIAGYFSADESKKYEAEKTRQPESAEVPAKQSFLAFDFNYLKNAGSIFQSCMTKPNKQDFFYLATKTFGLNLAIRAAFAVKSVMHGDIALIRAVVSTSWYQVQDAAFTVFGRTYMKFLGRMTGMLRVGQAYVGDFVFVCAQLCFFEFLNRLILGPIGQNPLVYTWAGIGLILLNNLQGMLSGGPLVPAISKMRKAGVISDPVMMHLYQISSLTMQLGLFATFGHQKTYFWLTSSVMAVAWLSYLIFSVFFQDPRLSRIASVDALARLDKFAADGYSAAARQP